MKSKVPLIVLLLQENSFLHKKKGESILPQDLGGLENDPIDILPNVSSKIQYKESSESKKLWV